jgi:ribosomal protein S18 acetylase RimI-like enzyme
MSAEIAVRVLQEDEWTEYRTLRLAALQESPRAFAATYADEAAQPEQYWRHSMRRADQLLASNDDALLGIASLEEVAEAAAANLCELWVTPKARNTGVASRLVQAATDQGIKSGLTKLYYWVSTENGRAIAFAINAGFRVTSERRTCQVDNEEFGDQQIALVLPLVDDPTARPTSSPSRLTSRPGPR